MPNKKYFKAFAFLGERGGVILKKRYKTIEYKGFDDFKVSFNGGEPVHIKTFKGRWSMYEKFDKEITKAQAKKGICESLVEM